MADISLTFDDMGRRWEGIILPSDQWNQLEQLNSVLTIARDINGELAGFVFNLDVKNLDHQSALTVIGNYFGEIVRATVGQPGASSGTIIVLPLSIQVVDIAEETALFPIFASVNAKARDVVISEDRARGVIKVSMRLPWWSAFVRPWVTVRRRGRPEVIALGSLRRSGGLHSAELRYGLPAPSSSLVAEVIRGINRPWLSSVVAAVIAAVFLFGAITIFGDRANDSVGITSDSVGSMTDTITLDPSKSSSTLLSATGVSFETPDQYVSARERFGAISVDRKQVGQSEVLNVTVKITGIFVNNFEDNVATNLQGLIDLCRARIGVPQTFAPVPAGWSPMVAVSLRGTNVRAGTNTPLTVVGNIPRECGNSLVSSSPLRISVVRMTYYRDVVVQLPIPKSLAPGTYDLELLPIEDNWQKSTPLQITVTG